MRMDAMHDRWSALPGGSRRLAWSLVALLAAGCATPAPSQLPAGAATPGSVPIEQLEADVTAAGIDCSDAHHTANDPGASDQATCGGLAHVIEMETFDSHDVMAAQFLPYLRDFFCHSSPDTIYLDGGTWAIYSTQNADITKIAGKIGIQPTKLCT
jgi:hypothetical protein